MICRSLVGRKAKDFDEIKITEYVSTWNEMNETERHPSDFRETPL
jgi:hypothetical protein